MMTQASPGPGFGNPRDPLGEAVRVPAEEELLMRDEFSMLRGISSKIVSFMSQFPDEVVSRNVGSYTVRSLRIDCSAPFDPELGIYLNGSQHYLEGITPGPVVLKDPTVIHVGDVVSGDSVVNRWARLSRPGGERFGVSGVSRIFVDGRIEQWEALTTTITRERGRPAAELWVEPGASGAPDAATRLTDDIYGLHDVHYGAMLRGIGRSLEKRTAD